MRRRVATWPCFVVALAASAVLPLGCKRGGSAGRENRVELSDARITVLGPKGFRVAIKYRFAQGKPNEDRACACSLEFRYGEKKAGGIAKLFQGNQGTLQPEGTLQGEYAFIPPIQPGDVISYEVSMTEASHDGSGHKPISNILTGGVKWDGNLSN